MDSEREKKNVRKRMTKGNKWGEQIVQRVKGVLRCSGMVFCNKNYDDE